LSRRQHHLAQSDKFPSFGSWSGLCPDRRCPGQSPHESRRQRLL